MLIQQGCFLYDKCNHKDCDKKFCMRRYKLEGLYKAALLPEAHIKDITLYADDDGTDTLQFAQLREILINVETWVKSGSNLYLHSHNCGNGKTTSAIKLVKAYLDKIWPRVAPECHALFISVPRFLLALKNQISNQDEYAEYIRENVLKADVVVWDDIAAKIGTEFELNHLLSLIDARLAMNKSNIFTSNLSKPELYRALGDRLGSRICGLSAEIELKGKDKRYLVVNNREG